MSTPSSLVTVPNEISRTDVLRGLWKCSAPARFFDTIPNGNAVRKKQEAAVWQQSKEELEKHLQKHPFVDYFGGRCIKTDMSKYPEIDLTNYKKQCRIAMSFSKIAEECIRRKS